MFVRSALLLLVASAVLVPPVDGRPVSQSAIFATSFEQEADANYDGWPDHWSRTTSPEYPHYTLIEIGNDPTAHNGRSLQVDFDGGGAFVSTPAIPILPKFGYKLYVRAKAEGLKYTRARMVIELQNRNKERLQMEVSEPLVVDGEWHEVDIASIRPISDDIDRAIVYLEAPRGRRGDLHAKVSIDQMILERLPSMVVKTGQDYNVYNDFKEVKVECTLSGIRQQNPEIRFQLLDETSLEIEGKSHTEPLDGKLIVEDSFHADDIVGTIGNRPSGYEGTTYWTPDIEDYGFYKIRVEMLREEDKPIERLRVLGELSMAMLLNDVRQVHRSWHAGADAFNDLAFLLRQNPQLLLKHLAGHLPHPASDYDRQLEERIITLAVLPKLPRPDKGEFGWTLPLGDNPLSLDILADMLPRVGVHWVKMPVWYPGQNRARGEEIVRFAERTSASGIEVVGILDSPIIDEYEHRDPNAASDIADLLLTDPSFWQPQFEHVMTRLSLRLRWWQLGNDWDTSFYGYSELSEKILSIRKHLFRFGQDVKLGLGWRWPQQGKEDRWIPPADDPMWEYEQMSAHPPLNADALGSAMSTTPKAGPMRWVLVDPTMHSKFKRVESQLSPPEKKQLHEDHVREFVREMVTAKIHGADGIFVANPFTGPEGVMNVDGTPGELLLPWRTTTHLLGGSRYLGTLQLPGSSTNHVFQNADGAVVMIVWNDVPTTEQLYLGERIECIDVWGKRAPVDANEQGEVTLAIDRVPLFVVGLHPEITAWRMAVEFDQLRIPSVFSRSHENVVRGVNHFRQGISGRFSIYVPPKPEEMELVPDLSGAPKPEEMRNTAWEVLPRRNELAVGARDAFEVPIHILLDDATYGEQPVRVDFEIEADQLYQFSVWRNLNVGTGDVDIAVSTRIDERGQLVVEQEMVNTGPQTADFKCLLYAPPRRRKRTQVVMLGPDGNKKVYLYPNGEELIGNVLKLRAEETSGHRVLIHRFRAEAGPPPIATESISSELPTAL